LESDGLGGNLQAAKPYEATLGALTERDFPWRGQERDVALLYKEGLSQGAIGEIFGLEQKEVRNLLLTIVQKVYQYIAQQLDWPPEPDD